MAAEENKEQNNRQAEAGPNGNHKNSVAERRGRMIGAGVIAAVILSVIAVVVAGIFQFTAGLVAPCPQDVPVNDPAPKLWDQLTSEKVKSRPLGVPERLTAQADFKGLPRENPKGRKPTSQ